MMTGSNDFPTIRYKVKLSTSFTLLVLFTAKIPIFSIENRNLKTEKTEIENRPVACMDNLITNMTELNDFLQFRINYNFI